ncbi:F0F1 ATP synthase subunit epsilon [Jannaschia donghaensis]|uniref:ATP synthase epsilon chain n=1 Tax=Jannaschia donghaensis TaxID=420998 RepID=A0A0M6YGI8_9RHOB|nr:F0F1 ATP synthase subunit epsilon [Jannaschia donghaensis]CTQ48196.1 F-ATPase epsilon subunit [Jannaschia donghaensis]
MQFELVSPERRLASEEVNAVRIPGADGDLTAMADHAPTITSLRPGILTIETASGEKSFAVTGGFAEIGAGVTVLAERALAVSDVTQDVFDDWVTQAATARDDASEDGVDAAVKLLADMVAVGDHIGLNSNQANL